ncbi:MAG: histidine phosphatase family protein [Deferrisomatales bacterium]
MSPARGRRRSESAGTPTRISLVRHGRVHNPGQVFYGRLPAFGLSPSGRDEARAAAAILSAPPLAAVFSSPLLRARQTATEISRCNGALRLRVSRLLLEVHTPFQGLPAEEVRRRADDVYTGAGPGFEQPADVLARVLRFVARTRRCFLGAHTAAVTHGDPIAFLALWAGGREITPANKLGLAPLGIEGGYPATGSVTTLIFPSSAADERPALEYRRPLPCRRAPSR